VTFVIKYFISNKCSSKRFINQTNPEKMYLSFHRNIKQYEFNWTKCVS